MRHQDFRDEAPDSSTIKAEGVRDRRERHTHDVECIRYLIHPFVGEPGEEYSTILEGIFAYQRGFLYHYPNIDESGPLSTKACYQRFPKKWAFYSERFLSIDTPWN